MRDYILLYINGQKHEIQGEKAFMSLTDYLRYEKGLKGTKVVCSEGDCGACTIIRGSLKSPNDSQLHYASVNACITFINLLDCTHIITVEGLKDNQELHPIQSAMIENNGAQCGFCTPGFVCSMADLMNNHVHQGERPLVLSHMSEKRIRNGLTGNLCRCTGYGPILEAAKEINLKEFPSLQSKFETPQMIEDIQAHQHIGAHIKTAHKIFFAPTRFEDMCTYQDQNQDSRLFSSGTDLGVLSNKNRYNITYISSLNLIPEAHQIKEENGYLSIGARVSLTEVEKATTKLMPEFSRLLHIFASPQIKNKGTLVGNIANASPIGDTLPYLMVANAEVELMGLKGTRRVNINDFYLGYKTLDMKPHEFISRVLIPVAKATQTFKLYKVSNRKDLDISTFTAGFMFQFQGSKIHDIRIAYGGVGPVVLRMSKTEAALKGQEFNLENLKKAGEIAKSEVTPISDVRASADYRYQVAGNILEKLYHELSDGSIKALEPA